MAVSTTGVWETCGEVTQLVSSRVQKESLLSGATVYFCSTDIYFHSLVPFIPVVSLSSISIMKDQNGGSVTVVIEVHVSI